MERRFVDRHPTHNSLELLRHLPRNSANILLSHLAIQFTEMLLVLTVYRPVSLTWPLDCAWEVAGQCLQLRYCREGVTHFNYNPWLSHTHPPIPISVSGHNQIRCAFCWDRSGVKRRTVSGEFYFILSRSWVWLNAGYIDLQMDLLTNIYHSELRVLTLSFIFTLHRSPQHLLSIFQSAMSSSAVPRQRLLTVEILQLHALRSSCHSRPCRTLVNWQLS
jgi:hypothetical protein